MNCLFILFLTTTITTIVQVLSFSSSSITKPIQYQSYSGSENNPRHVRVRVHHQHHHSLQRFSNNHVVNVVLSSSLSCSMNNSRQHNTRRRIFQRCIILRQNYLASSRIDLSKLYNSINDDNDDDANKPPLKLGNRYNSNRTIASVLIGAIISIIILSYRQFVIKILNIENTLSVVRNFIQLKDIIIFCRATISIFGSVSIGLYIDYILLLNRRKKNHNNSNNNTTTTTKISTNTLTLPPWLLLLSTSSSSWTIFCTLCISAIISTIGIAPKPPHVLYDACWTYFLPSSLSFLLLSLKSINTEQQLQQKQEQSTSTILVPEATNGTGTTFVPAKQSTRTSSSSNTATRTAIIRLAIPFLLACIGSYVGCYISFLCFRHVLFLSLPLSSTSIAAIASSCLLSSFIGGSVNFMATASTIVTSLSSTSLSTTKTFSNLLSAMSTADIIVMAIYFFMLSSMLKIKQLQCLFSSSILQQEQEQSSVCGSNKTTSPRIETNSSITPALLTNSEASSNNDLMIPTTNTSKLCLNEEPKQTPSQRLSHTIIPMLISCLISLSIVWSSRQMERLVVQSSIAIPGTACAFIAVLTPMVANIITKYSLFIQKRWYTIQSISQILSNVSFLLLFACLGVSADIYSTFVGNGLSCFIFSLVVLLLHVFFVLVSSLLYYTIMKLIFIPKIVSRNSVSSLVGIQSNNKINNNYCRKWWSISLIDILVASNAAIGGPATAAAFCGTIKQSMDETDDYDNNNSNVNNNNINSFLQWQKGLTIAATFWGVVGYAIGTTVGLSYYRFLRV